MDDGILLVGGAPALRVDAIRSLRVQATGRTALRLAALLKERGHRSDLLLGSTVAEGISADRYEDREQLDVAIRAWAEAHPAGTVVLTAAVNDYQVHAVESLHGQETVIHEPGDKIPSGADEICIRLRPALKLVDQLRGEWRFAGRLICCKYEAQDTVIDGARQLMTRVEADCVLANSLCGTTQALVTRDGIEAFADREAVLKALADRIIDREPPDLRG